MQNVKRSRLPARTDALYSAAPKAGWPAAGSVARPVDRRLGLFDPDAELKRLGLDRHAAAQQHAVGVAGAVADGQDRHVGGDVARRGRQTAEPAVGDVEVLDPARKPDLAAQLLKLAPQGPDDQRQPVRPEMRPVLVDDRRLAVTVGEDFQDAGHVGPGAARRELAVAEGAGPPFAEEVVAFGVERPRLVEPADVGDPVLDGPAAFQDQGAIAVAARADSRRTGRPGRRRRSRADARSGVEPGLRPVEALGNVRSAGPRGPCRCRSQVFVGQFDRGRVDEMDVVVAAGVEALAEDPPVQRSRRGGRPSRAAIFSGRPSSGSSSSRRMLATLIDMGRSRHGTAESRGHASQASGPKQISVMSSTWLWPAENSRMSWRMARPTASGPPGVSASFCSSRRLSRES